MGEGIRGFAVDGPAVALDEAMEVDRTFAADCAPCEAVGTDATLVAGAVVDEDADEDGNEDIREAGKALERGEAWS